MDRHTASQVLRSATGQDQPDLGEVVQWSESGMIFSPPNRHKLRKLEDGSFYISLRDSIILCDTTSGNTTLNLPKASKAAWKVYTIKKADTSANQVDIVPDGTEVVDGASSLSLTASYESTRIASDGSSWWTI
jgi:hypothetical protein